MGYMHEFDPKQLNSFMLVGITWDANKCYQTLTNFSSPNHICI